VIWLGLRRQRVVISHSNESNHENQGGQTQKKDGQKQTNFWRSSSEFIAVHNINYNLNCDLSLFKSRI